MCLVSLTPGRMKWCGVVSRAATFAFPGKTDRRSVAVAHACSLRVNGPSIVNVRNDAPPSR